MELKKKKQTLFQLLILQYVWSWNISKTFIKETFAVMLIPMEGPKSLQLQLMVITGKSVLNV